MRGDADMAAANADGDPASRGVPHSAHVFACQLAELERVGHIVLPADADPRCTCADLAPDAGGQQTLGLVPATDPIGDVVPSPGRPPAAVRGTSDVGAVVRMIRLEVLGEPAPKGSGRAMLIGGKARHIASGSTVNQLKLKAFDVAVREAVREVLGEVTTPPLMGKPVHIEVTFRMKRPTGHYGTGKNAGTLKPNAPTYPTTKPDSSKLLRAIEDTLKGIVYGDDSNIVDHVIRKRYAAPGTEGATIIVREATEA